jgi:uncharacterized protein
MYKTGLAAAALAAMLLAPLKAQAGGDDQFASATEAYRFGIGAIAAGDTGSALPALTFAAERGVLGAQVRLARLYARGQGVPRDDAKALFYYQQIADQRAEIALISPVAPYVAEAFVAVGRYYRDGVPEANLAPDAYSAASLFRHAASYFGDADAQFALARLYLAGEGVEANPGLAVNWLTNAVKKKHPQSQALLGELLWKGELVQRRPARALALITLAQESSKLNETERAWVDALYRETVLAADENLRLQAIAVAERWRGGPAPAAVAADETASQSKQLVVPASGTPSQNGGTASEASAGTSAEAPARGRTFGINLGFGESGGSSQPSLGFTDGNAQ